jgi:hypothetical protein
LFDAEEHPPEPTTVSFMVQTMVPTPDVDVAFTVTRPVGTSEAEVWTVALNLALFSDPKLIGEGNDTEVRVEALATVMELDP